MTLTMTPDRHVFLSCSKQTNKQTKRGEGVRTMPIRPRKCNTTLLSRLRHRVRPDLARPCCYDVTCCLGGLWGSRAGCQTSTLTTRCYLNSGGVNQYEMQFLCNNFLYYWSLTSETILKINWEWISLGTHHTNKHWSNQIWDNRQLPRFQPS